MITQQHFISDEKIACCLLVEILARLYIEGEKTYVIDTGSKDTVTVTPMIFTLSDEALKQFRETHDSWEMDVCKKYAHDNFIGGKTTHFTFCTSLKPTKQEIILLCLFLCLYEQVTHAWSSRPPFLG